jgi:hypothetical protein
MALWNSGATWSSGQLWGPSATAGPTFENTKKHQPNMKRQPYYPKNLGDQPEWHTNFATKLPTHAAALPLTQPEEDAGVADNLIMGYGLGGWILAVREHSTACTASLETLSSGTGAANFAFPVFTPPAPPTLPAGITGVKPGALDRIFKLVKLIKTRPGYTPEIGLDLGIIGPELPPPPPPGEEPPPRIQVKAVSGPNHQIGRVKFFKDGHEYVVIESRRAGGAWEQIAQSNKSPFLDERALLVAGQAEVREYRALLGQRRAQQRLVRRGEDHGGAVSNVTLVRGRNSDLGAVRRGQREGQAMPLPCLSGPAESQAGNPLPWPDPAADPPPMASTYRFPCRT